MDESTEYLYRVRVFTHLRTKGFELGSDPDIQREEVYSGSSREQARATFDRTKGRVILERIKLVNGKEVEVETVDRKAPPMIANRRP